MLPVAFLVPPAGFQSSDAPGACVLSPVLAYPLPFSPDTTLASCPRSVAMHAGAVRDSLVVAVTVETGE